MAATFVTLRKVAPKAAALFKISSTPAPGQATRPLATGIHFRPIPAFATEQMTLNERPAPGSRSLEWFSVDATDGATFRETGNAAVNFDDLADIVNPPSDSEIFRRWI